MTSKLSLSAVLFALALAPAAFANGAEEQMQDASAPNPELPAANPPITREAAPAPASITQAVLERLDLEVRAGILGSLRESASLVLQLAAPVLGEVVGAAGESLEIGSR